MASGHIAKSERDRSNMTEQCFALNSVDISTFVLNSQVLMIRKRNDVLDWGSHLKLIAGAVVGG